MIGKICVLGLVLTVLRLDIANSQVSFSTVLSWNTISFQYDSPGQEQADINSGLYDRTQIAPIDVDADVRRGSIYRYFLTFPRFMGTSPATLGYVTGSGKNLKVIPYPSLERNYPVCSKQNLISVYRVQVQQECNKLWVLDTGIFGDSLRCPPKIVAYDLTTDKPVYVFEIPSHLYESRSILVTINVETLNSCSDTFIYVADCQANSIIVIDTMRNKAWRAIDKTMYPSPECGTIKIQRDQFELMDGVLGMSLKKEKTGNKLFFYPLSSGRMHWVYTSHLRDESLFEFAHSAPQIFNSYKTVRPTQSAALAIDSQGVAYSGLVEESSITCWNTGSSDYGLYINEFYRNKNDMQFPTGVKMISDSRGEHLFVVTPRLQKIVLDNLDTNDVNFRVSAASTHYIYNNTMCTSRDRTITKYYSVSPCDVCDSKKYRLSGYPTW